MAKNTKPPWDQLKGEPAASYARFLIYRNLGPARSLDMAYVAYLANTEDEKATDGNKKRIPGSWGQESLQWRWPERAASWDIAMLAQLGQRAIVAFAAFFEALSKRALSALADPTVQPRSWEALLHTAEVLNGLIAPETVEAALAQQGVPEKDGPDAPPIAGSIGP